MISTSLPTRPFPAEPIEITSRRHKQQVPDCASPSSPVSRTSDSTTLSMAGETDASSPPEADEFTKYGKEAEHMENVGGDHVSIANGGTRRKGVAVDGMPDANSPQPSQKSEDASQHKPRRKHAPEPVETTSRTTRRERNADTHAPSTTKRKFAPEPIETTTRTSKPQGTPNQGNEPPQPRRKFAVEPVEITSTSSKERGKKADGSENDARLKRRFAVEPVETSTRSSKEKDDNGKTTKPKRRFAIEPVETSTSSSRTKKANSEDDQRMVEVPSRSSSGGRRFEPELVATAKASFRKKPSVGSAVPKWLRVEIGDDDGSRSAPEEGESKFSAANLAKKARAETRRHSYCVPDLPIIQSDSSEDELLSPQTPSTLSRASSREPMPKPSKWRRNQVHPHQQHLDDLQTLRDQAVAAYGQQEDLIPFGHYGGDSEDEDYSFSVGELSIQDNADPSLFRRMSHNDLHLVMEDMRRHHEQLEKAKQGLQEDTAGISRFSAVALAARHRMQASQPAENQHRTRRETREQKDNEDEEFAKMRKAASPPMAGDELKFPFSVSPRMTRCDTDQVPRPRRANSEDDEEHDIGQEDLWSTHVVPVLKTAPTGLWGGLCQRDESNTRPGTPLRSGLQTPAFEVNNPFESRTPGRGTRTPRRIQPFAGSTWLALTPPTSKNEKVHDSFTAALDKKLIVERQIDEEFPPRVITQIYNYLSLGYPSIARAFDDELSKISRISVVEMRQGDRTETGTMKGHVGAPETEGEGEEDGDGRVKGCRRWEALRLYVREWARQSPQFADAGVPKNVGTGMWGNNAPVRKGSWGF